MKGQTGFKNNTVFSNPTGKKSVHGLVKILNVSVLKQFVLSPDIDTSIIT